ncbi:lamin tail domain-containing protein [Dehalogenimonas alkenigignens]|uniref:lamin tail domain-containing protein n=1 Tax=Dehalogenimonas alkenigignens TaxID=1217799 RepID=UPI0009FA4ABE
MLLLSACFHFVGKSQIEVDVKSDTNKLPLDSIFIEISNLGNQAVNLNWWVLKDISDGYPSFTFPSYTLQPNQRIRVYTDQVHPSMVALTFPRH